MTASISILFAALFTISAPLFAHAAEINGIQFAEQVSVGGKNLKLNGLGLRQATFLNVNVYAGALYLETLSHDGEQIAQSPELKRIEMVFMREVGAEKISNAWMEGFENNCVESCEAAKAGINQLQSITAEMKKGDKMAFSLFTDHVEVTVKDQKPVTITGKELARTLVRLWIGRKPPNTSLKAGLLGIKD